nr:unnamed protein product [Callosobruchus analis]
MVVDELLTKLERKGGVGRLREPSLLEAIILYLAYLHHKRTDVWIDGKTSASIRLRLTTEGLPSKREELLKLYKQFFAAYELTEADVKADLSVLRAQTHTHRMAYLYTAREVHARYYSPVDNKRRL